MRREINKVGHNYIHQSPVEVRAWDMKDLAIRMDTTKSCACFTYSIFFSPMISLDCFHDAYTTESPSLSSLYPQPSSMIIFLTYLWVLSLILLPDTCFEFSSLFLNTYLSYYVYQIRLLLGFIFPMKRIHHLRFSFLIISPHHLFNSK